MVLGLLIVSVSSYADDKQYFRIEGLTIGESLLKYMSKEKIIENDRYIIYLSAGISYYFIQKMKLTKMY